MFCKNCGQQIKNNEKFCKNCGIEVVKYKIFNHIPEWLKKPKMIILTTIIIMFLIILIALYVYGASLDGQNNNESTNQNIQVQEEIVTSINQNEIVSSIVNILCNDGIKSSGGSGTIISSGGVILTNAHIIPQDKEGNPTIKACVITLPDTQGKIKEVYFGKPTIIPYLSSRYDLAFLNINEVYIDKDGVSYGQYPNTFPSFMEMGCINNDPRLGEYVRVFGYPAISAGGYYLTITDGLVSSLPNDGTIYTSAKIDHGSSGGLAVDENGCMLGIPSMISGDENESLGVLISNQVISEFLDKFQSLLNLVN